MAFTHRVDQYALDVGAGRIVAGPLVRLACKRHLADRKLAARKQGHPRGFYFDEAAADHIIAFFETVLRLPDTLGDDGEAIPFLLTPANTFIVGSVFGWKMPTGLRRYREVYVEMGKGNAKTPLAAGVGLYGLVMDGEQAAEIYSAATGMDQAKLCWIDADRMVLASPELSEIIYRSQNNLAHEPSLSFFRPVSNEKRGKSGPRPHMGLIDELHEAADGVIVNKIRAGAKRRKQPLFFEITNSGYDRTSICWQHHEHSRKILEGIVEDDRWFSYVCALDGPRTEVYHSGKAVQTMVNLCSCRTNAATLIDHIRAEVCAAHAISAGTENRARIDALSIQIDQLDRQGSARSAMTARADSDLSTGSASENTKSDGPRKTSRDSLSTNEIGSTSDQDIGKDRHAPRNLESSDSLGATMTGGSLSSKAAVRSVKKSHGRSGLTTTTSLADLEDLSVTTAIRESVFSEILSRAYLEHSPICKVTTDTTVSGPSLIVNYPPDDPLADSSCHIKANPNLGVVIQQDYLDRQVTNAKNIPAETNTVLRLNFCVWTQAHSAYFDRVKWDGCNVASDAELVGRPCYGGLDLGQSDDFTAWVRIWLLPDGRVGVRCRFWLPESALTKYPERPYSQWQRAGLLTVTEGDTTDLDVVEATVLQDCRDSAVLELSYDKKFASQLALHLQGAGITMVDTPQGFALNEAIRKVSAWVVTGDLCHNSHAILGWMADNVVVVVGRNGELRIDKERAKEKIDGISALTMAASRAIVSDPGASESSVEVWA